MGKRGQNEGSIRKRKDGSWEGRYTTKSGERKSVYGKTRQEVNQKLSKILAEINRGTYIEPSKVCFSEVYENWKPFGLDPVADATKSQYLYLFNKHILPYFGGMKVSDINETTIQNFINEKNNDYAPYTVRMAKTLVASVLDIAVEDQLIARNPARSRKKIKLPKDKPDHEKSNPLELEDLQSLLDHAKKRLLPPNKGVKERKPDRRLAMALWLGSTCGFRRGEVLGLRKSDIDTRRKMIRPREAFGTVNGKGVKKGLKNETSYNPVLLTDSQCTVIQDYLKWHAEVFPNSIHLFPSTKNPSTPVSPRWFTKMVADTAVDAGLDGTRFHDMRHTHGYLMMESGADSFTVQERLRHKDYRSTRRYVKASARRQRAAVQNVVDLVQKVSEKDKKNGAD
ncbi:tyrosine-type recombinase/integrase [Anaeroselena agilis]|uniref:Site-specific integrase n=1 Tax=Anaeroselena agilis TaxID=3063788 RepID=A0ABU3NVP8_9FIRM|nr:site-specific integrase [Selenomonadales bacterium 4137-cl]